MSAQTESSGSDGAPQDAPHHEVLLAGVRGAIAAMAMTGMRAFTVDLGIVEQSPPDAIMKQRARGLIRLVPRKRRRATVELAH